MMTTYDLNGKKAVVTGASSGIGRSTAIALARNGADVIVVARRKQRLDEVVRQIEALGRRGEAVSVDVSDKAQVDELTEKIIPEFGGVDIFVNNAGVTVFKRLIDTTPEEMDKVINTNLKGTIFCLQGASRQMLKQDRGGSIIIVTSVNALRPLPPQAVYSSIKAAMESLNESLAVDLAGAGIRVNTVAPGAINTEMTNMTEDALKRVGANIPLGRVGEGDDIADVICFLASDDSRYMTGSTILADGGLALRRG